MAHRTRIMYIERKADGIVGPARIGRVTYSKSGKSLSYDGRQFHTLGGGGFKANYADSETGEEFWISGPRKDGRDALYSTSVEVDDDVREEYWVTIRNKPEMRHLTAFKCTGKYSP
jgi:hypothetical protein